MFLIYTLDDKILLKPDEMNMKLNGNDMYYEDIVLEKTKEKYLGKVLLGHGLVVTIKKLLLKAHLIVEMEGVINVEYEMDLIIFKPQIGDLLYGKIVQSDFYYITIDCEIIKVRVPVEQLMKPNGLNDSDNIWFWKYDDYKLYYDIGEEVRMKVIEVSFKSSQEISKLTSNINEQSQIVNMEVVNYDSSKQKIMPDMIMEILCTFNQEGLGPLKWWQTD